MNQKRFDFENDPVYQFLLYEFVFKEEEEEEEEEREVLSPAAIDTHDIGKTRPKRINNTDFKPASPDSRNRRIASRFASRSTSRR